jgi:peptide/nickel transport system permease protein
VGLTIGYVVRRLLVFVAVVWIAATINFVVPRLAPGDPVTGIIQRMAQQGMRIEGYEQLVREYRRMFGLDDPLPIQYLKSVTAMLRGEMGYSLSYFPAKVSELIQRSIWWTIGLLSTATLIAFVLGTVLGAVLAWHSTPRLARLILPLFMTFGAIPSYLVAILLLYVFAFGLKILPSSGAISTGEQLALTPKAMLDVIRHSILPALSIVLASLGGWALGMRGMMVTVIGEDYLTLAEAKGLRERRIFWRYAVRNAILPQITSLAIALGHVASGALLVEVIFAYPGIGWLLYTAIANSDFALIQGITFILVLSVAIAILILDLLYPWLDPRITYARR